MFVVEDYFVKPFFLSEGGFFCSLYLRLWMELGTVMWIDVRKNGQVAFQSRRREFGEEKIGNKDVVSFCVFVKGSGGPKQQVMLVKL